MYHSLSQQLENAFDKMNIRYRKAVSQKQMIYWLNLPESTACSAEVIIVISDLFTADIHAFIAKGVTAEKRRPVLEAINELNDKYDVVCVVLDNHNDVYTCQQFILAGTDRIMCKQIMTNLLVFYDLYLRTSEKIRDVMNL